MCVNPGPNFAKAEDPTIPWFVFLIKRKARIMSMIVKDDLLPPFLRYDGQESFFGGQPPLSKSVGYFVVLGFGALFSIITTAVSYTHLTLPTKA